MKNSLAVLILLAGATAGYSQGYITFYNYGPGLIQAIFNPSTGNNTIVSYGGYSVSEERGSTPGDTPSGPFTYDGLALAGTGYDVECLAAPGASQPLSALAPAGTVENFETGNKAGFFAVETIYFSQNTSVVTIAIAAWNNGNGACNTLAAAEAAGVPWGISSLGNDALSSGLPAYGSMPVAIESFSLGTTVPEPGTISLALAGAAALWRNSRKRAN